MKKILIIIHRAILGSIERFMGLLIEHYGKDVENKLDDIFHMKLFNFFKR